MTTVEGISTLARDEAVGFTKSTASGASGASGTSDVMTEHIVSWVDYSSKYGVGYLTQTGAVGVVFNDDSRILLAPSRSHFMYMPVPRRSR